MLFPLLSLYLVSGTVPVNYSRYNWSLRFLSDIPEEHGNSGHNSRICGLQGGSTIALRSYKVLLRPDTRPDLSRQLIHPIALEKFNIVVRFPAHPAHTAP